MMSKFVYYIIPAGTYEVKLHTGDTVQFSGEEILDILEEYAYLKIDSSDDL